MVIPNSITSIGENAFSNIPYLKEVELHENTAFSGTEFDGSTNITYRTDLSAPSSIYFTGLSFVENTPIGTSIAILNSTDKNKTDTHTYRLISGKGSEDNGFFKIEDNELLVRKLVNYESKSSYKLRIQTRDTGGQQYTQSFAISLEDRNDSPTDIFLSEQEFNEGISDDTVISNIDTVDDDKEDNYSYSLVGGDGDVDNKYFAISGNQLKIIRSPDLETKSSYSIRLQTKDPKDLAYEKSFKLKVNKVIENSIPKPIPTPEPTTSPNPTPTPEPTTAKVTTPTQELTTETVPTLISKLQSIDDITSQNQVTKFQLTKSIQLQNQQVEMLISGTNKKDKITGSSEGEILSGGKGKDVLKGGDGADGFLFQNPDFGKKEADNIKDFNDDEGDSIIIDKKVFDVGKKISLKSVSGKKALASSKEFVYHEKKGLLYFNENGKEKGWGDGGLFVKLQGAPELTQSDFTIV